MTRRDEAPPARQYGDVTLLVRLLREARPYWTHIVGVFLLGLLATPIALLTPVPLKIAVDSVIGDHPLPGFLDALIPDGLSGSESTLLLFAACLFVAVAALEQLQVLGSTVLGAYTGERLVLRFRTRLFSRAQRLSLAYHDRRGTADAVYRIQYDAPAIQHVAVYGVTPLVSALFTLAGMIYVTARIDWALALIALTVTPMLFLLTWLARGQLRGGWREAKHLESSAMSVVQEVLTGLRVVKAFGQEEREQERFAERSGASVRKRIRLAFAEGAFSLLIGLTTAGGAATVLFVGVRHQQAGRITTGDLILVMAYLLQLYAPLRVLSKSVTTLQSSFASAERVFTVLDEVTDVPELPDARPLRRAHGAVEFRNVSFAYEGERPVLENLSFEVGPGTRVGISGATGAGKTTLISLLTRFYDPMSGSILLDGLDLRVFRLADLRSQFAIVLQEPLLFSTSIAENIAYARPEASLVEVIAAARAANVHDFVASLPDGYGTEVGERGMRLSGGERQRISLARAFLKDAPILILDEPTSSVDLATESAILDAMERLAVGRTTFTIAHRLSTLENCDARLELEHGRLVEASARAGAQAGERVMLLRDHPAARAWSRLASGPDGLLQVDVVEESSGAGAYRLVRPNGARAVIAKRRRPPHLAVERTLYERVFPSLPVATPRYIGTLEEDGWTWLMIEDVGGAAFSADDPAHALLAVDWLARMHASAAVLAAVAGLPERGPDYYLGRLRAAREAMVETSEAHPALAEAARLCDRLEQGWETLARLCSGKPRTLVHGDFVPKNLSVRGQGPGAELVVFDWETAGIAVPAADLVQIAQLGRLPEYEAAARRHGLRFGAGGAASLAAAGTVFRYVASLDWAAQQLPYAWVAERSLLHIREYVPRLLGAARAAGMRG